MSTRSWQFYLAIFIAFTAGVVFVSFLAGPGRSAEPGPAISTPRQVQEFLKAQGHPRYDPGKIDGVPGPRTNQAWVNWYCDQISNKAFEQ